MFYKLIAMDLDGTLLSENRHIPVGNINAVKYAQNLGVYVMLCTGRILMQAVPYANSLGINGIIITGGGTTVSDLSTGSILNRWNIEIEDIKKALPLIRKYDIPISYFCEDDYFTEERYLEVFMSKEDLKDESCRMISLTDCTEHLLSGANIQKFYLKSHDKSKIKQLRERLIGIDSVHITSSYRSDLEIHSCLASKGIALKYVCETMGICIKRVIAIGDNENDIPMFEVAGVSVCVNNGHEEAKRAADIITRSSAEGGVAEAVYRLLKHENSAGEMEHA